MVLLFSSNYLIYIQSKNKRWNGREHRCAVLRRVVFCFVLCVFVWVWVDNIFVFRTSTINNRNIFIYVVYIVSSINVDTIFIYYKMPPCSEYKKRSIGTVNKVACGIYKWEKIRKQNFSRCHICINHRSSCLKLQSHYINMLFRIAYPIGPYWRSNYLLIISKYLTYQLIESVCVLWFLISVSSPFHCFLFDFLLSFIHNGMWRCTALFLVWFKNWFDLHLIRGCHWWKEESW